jgi:MinD-like ATPase involved in chromosome partitioning or flagellar assembly
MPHGTPSTGGRGPLDGGPLGGVDDVEARAAALQEQMAARRARQLDPEPPHTSPDHDPDDRTDRTDRTEGAAPRRLPLPPWQIPNGVVSRDIGQRFERDVEREKSPLPPPPADDHVAAARPEREPVEPALPQEVWQPAPQRDVYPTQAWPPGPLPPPPGWLPPPPPGWLPPPPPPHAHVAPPEGFRVPAPSLDDAKTAGRPRSVPQSGWRRALHRVSGGLVNPGESRKARERDDLIAQIRQPIVGDFRIAVLSIKGGVGKTTTTLGLGSTLALVRSDRVIAVDANPDRGTLAERVGDMSTQSTVRDLLSDPHVNRYADVRSHTRMATSRLEVLASEQEPAVSEVFGEPDYRRTVDILGQYYNVILTDCGTGIMHSAMAGVLDLAHAIVLVSSPAIDAARSASATLDWLMQHGHSALVREAHVVLSSSRPGSAALKLDKVFEHFAARCRSIHLIPFDPHLAEGADVDFSLLNPPTAQAYLELAAAVSEKFPRLNAGRHQR